MLKPLGRPSITLVIRAMLLMAAGMPSIMMGVVSPPWVRMLTTCVVPILVGAASFLGQRILLPIVIASV